ncbi:MAG TPA: hypothetical protein VMF32_17900 [Xanthobacteraceae bacterium]|nr:hypothetical protein [Xanthobacteraceae bacterium]
MAGKIIAAVAAILLGTTALASAQVLLLFPHGSYWYGSGYYSPLTGTGIGEPPLYAPRHYNYAPGHYYGYAPNYHGRSDDSWDYNWWK